MSVAIHIDHFWRGYLYGSVTQIVGYAIIRCWHDYRKSSRAKATR